MELATRACVRFAPPTGRVRRRLASPSSVDGSRPQGSNRLRTVHAKVTTWLMGRQSHHPFSLISTPCSSRCVARGPRCQMTLAIIDTICYLDRTNSASMSFERCRRLGSVLRSQYQRLSQTASAASPFGGFQVVGGCFRNGPARCNSCVGLSQRCYCGVWLLSQRCSHSHWGSGGVAMPWMNGAMSGMRGHGLKVSRWRMSNPAARIALAVSRLG